MLRQQRFRDVALVLRGAQVSGTPEAYSSFWELIAINIDEVYLNLFKVYLSCTNQACRRLEGHHLSLMRRYKIHNCKWLVCV